MADEALREQERRARASGADADAAAALVAAVRAGQLTRAALRLRAFTGDAAAALAVEGDVEPRRVEPAPAVAAALASFEGAGGALRHHLFEPPGAPDDPAAHELVARLTARVFGEADAAVRRPEATRGAPIGLAELLGAEPLGAPAGWVDLGHRRLLFPTSGVGGMLPAEQAMAARDRQRGFADGNELCYARTFQDPPYGVRLSLVEVSRLFDVIWPGLASWDPDGLVACSWTTDAWDRYAAGREWWGSPLWTIAPRDGRPWVGVTASATD